MDQQDIRWKQRLSNFSKALDQLTKFIDKGQLNELEEQGLIKVFEYTYELAWNVIKDYFESQGETGLTGSRDAFRMAYKRGIIDDEEIWMDMIKSRILTSHTYDEEIANKISSSIMYYYYPQFRKLHDFLKKLLDKNNA